MILTRELINKNIKYHDWVIKYDHSNFQEYDFNYLSALVNAYKNLLLSKNATVGQKIIIASRLGVEQLALILACAELGLTMMVVGNPFSRIHKENTNLNLKHYGKADFFIVKNKTCTKQFEVFKNICGKTIVLEDENLDFTLNNTILATENSVLLELLDIDKTATHNHAFMVSVLQRNSKLLYGNIGTSLDSLNHGISPSIHFLSGLMTDSVTDYYNFYVVENSLTFLASQLEKQNTRLQHLFVPYTVLVNGSMSAILTDCIIYTIGTIRADWINRVNNKRVKDIVSLFGNIETYGPVLFNSLTSQNFVENSYKKLDDFYAINITDSNELSVTVPVYNKNVIINNDLCFDDNGKYIFRVKPKE